MTSDLTPEGPAEPRRRFLALPSVAAPAWAGLASLAVFAIALWLGLLFLDVRGGSAKVQLATDRLLSVERLFETAKNTRLARLEYLLTPNDATRGNLQNRQTALGETVAQLLRDHGQTELEAGLLRLKDLMKRIRAGVAATPGPDLHASFLTGPLAELTAEFFNVVQGLRRGEAARLLQYEAQLAQLSTRMRPLLIVMLSLSLFLISSVMLNQRQARATALRARYLEQVAAEKDRADLLARELSHRVKNLFAVIGSIVTMTARHESDLKTCAETIRQRIHALSLAHTVSLGRSGALLSDDQPRLQLLIRNVTRPYCPPEGQFELSGDNPEVHASMITPIGLVFNELATNALKYGAWSVAKGRVSVAIKQDASGEISAIHWRERGGPAPQERDAGFGTVMTDASAVQLGLKITRDWGPEGLEVTFTATAQENE